MKQTEQRIQTICLLLLSAVAIAFALYWLRPVMIPFVLAVFFTIALTPLVDLFALRLRLPRAMAIAATLVVGLVVLALVGVLVTISVEQIVDNSDQYAEQIELLGDKLEKPLENLGWNPDALKERFKGDLGSMLMSTGNSLMNIVSQGVLVAIFVLFLLVGGTTRLQPTEGTRGEVESRIKGYILTKLLTSAATGVLVGITLTTLGVEPAIVFGLFGFLLNFIPSVGSIVAVLLPLPIVLMDPDIGLLFGALAFVIPGTINFVIGNVVEPKIMGSSLDLHPVVILLALIFWGMLWGIVGMLLATPITAVTKILLEKMELTMPVAQVLAGRAPTPPPSA